MASSDEFKRTYRHGTIVIWPPDDVRATVGALRQRYDPASQAICDAHITLTQPCEREPDAADLAQIRAVASAHPSVELEYGPLATFLPYPCVYLEIQPASAVRSLRAALHELGLFNLTLPFSDPDEFIPHMSITDGYPDEAQTRSILAALSGSEPCGRFQLTSIAWIRPDEDFHFETVEMYPLGCL